MTGFNAKYHATGTKEKARAMWKNPSTTEARQYAIKNPSGTYGSASWVKKDTGNGPNMAMIARISRKKLPEKLMLSPHKKRFI